MINPDVPHMAYQAEIEQYGAALWADVRRRRPSRLSADYWLGRMLDASMRDPAFRTPLFHLVDVLPVLADAEGIASHALALLRATPDPPLRMRLLRRLMEIGPAGRLMAAVMRRQTESLGRRFIVDATWEGTIPKLRALHEAGLAFTIDLLGEVTHSEHEAREYHDRYTGLINHLADQIESWPHWAVVQESATGPVPAANVSVKLSALDPRIDCLAIDASVSRLVERVRPLLALCRDRNVFLNFDMESWSMHEVTLRFFERITMDPDFRAYPHIGMVLQAYLRDAELTADRMIALNEQRGTPFTIRLVKGAYWDYEVAHARQYGFQCPVHTQKSETDAQYERISRRLLDRHEHVSTAFAGHNIRSITHAIVQAERLGLPQNAYELQMLYGAAKPERDALRDRGFRVRMYAPVGEILPGMAYLVRRLLENSANTGFLRQAYQEHADITQLLQPPAAA
jgi:RHH-type transcriptional regulator, proline utilization regulon repressor / proline dehydrogenase / delta 1-pyrroline-5-carboxylate dehydrogenase